ncbi:hypothetical protein Dip518_001559 [Parelusimicrobium proximum]|uniref:lysylphosphatidylglycerol synthase transmembrane domain-containing protein n=1 Tax=Parelusimicrobium proximum TaxID=3228953 RepID=UPI003D164C6B
MSTNTQKTLKRVFYALGLIISVSLVAVLIYTSKDAFVKIWSEVRTKYLITSAVCAALIYICMGLSLWEVLKVMGKKINVFSAIGIALVSTTVNYLVSSMGVSGFALRAHLLGKKRVPFGLSVTASIVTTVLLYFVLALIILQGSIMLFFKSSDHSTMQIFQSIAVIVFMSFFCGAIVTFLFNNELRVKFIRKTFRLINRIGYKLFSVIIPKARFDSFTEQLEIGIHAIHKKRKQLTKAIIYICMDWLFTMLVLYFAFRAVGIMISPAVLVTGFAIGMATTLIPILPGGLGAMELAMTAVYNRLGIGWDQALMACLIYRVLYYIIPGIVSIFVYWIIQFSSHRREKRIKREAQKS